MIRSQVQRFRRFMPVGVIGTKTTAFMRRMCIDDVHKRLIRFELFPVQILWIIPSIIATAPSEVVIRLRVFALTGEVTEIAKDLRIKTNALR